MLFAELALVLGGWTFAPETGVLRFTSTPAGMDNTRALGRLIYTDYILLFQSAGLILMVAMIGAIVLTHRERTGSRRQSIARQNARNPADTLTMVTVGRGRGVAADEILRPRAEPEPVLAGDEKHTHGVDKPGPGEH